MTPVHFPMHAAHGSRNHGVGRHEVSILRKKPRIAVKPCVPRALLIGAGSTALTSQRQLVMFFSGIGLGMRFAILIISNHLTAVLVIHNFIKMMIFCM